MTEFTTLLQQGNAWFFIPSAILLAGSVAYGMRISRFAAVVWTPVSLPVSL
nr:hypothetical protein [Escherichia coli]